MGIWYSSVAAFERMHTTSARCTDGEKHEQSLQSHGREISAPTGGMTAPLASRVAHYSWLSMRRPWVDLHNVSSEPADEFIS